MTVGCLDRAKKYTSKNLYITTRLRTLDLFMLSRDFVHGHNDKSTIFFDDSNLWFEDFREVEHDLETCQRPWFTWILTPWASQGPKNWKWSIKKYRTFVITSMHKNCQTTWTSPVVMNHNIRFFLKCYDLLLHVPFLWRKNSELQFSEGTCYKIITLIIMSSFSHWKYFSLFNSFNK